MTAQIIVVERFIAIKGWGLKCTECGKSAVNWKYSVMGRPTRHLGCKHNITIDRGNVDVLTEQPPLPL